LLLQAWVLIAIHHLKYSKRERSKKKKMKTMFVTEEDEG